MGDDLGLGLLTSVLGGALRGGQMLKSAFRVADPKRVGPIIQSLKPAVQNTAKSLFKPSEITKSIPVVNRLPGWVRDFVVPSSPIGIATGFVLGAPGDTIQREERYGPEIPSGSGTQYRTIVTTPTTNNTFTGASQGRYTEEPASRLIAVKTLPETQVVLEPTPEGQFQRYFKSPEFDYIFGETSRGGGAPTSVEDMLELAKAVKAQKDIPLATYYRAQSAAGQSQIDEIKRALGYAEGSDMAKWAEANPMLAQRLYTKKIVG